jgi:hypothetical protein
MYYSSIYSSRFNLFLELPWYVTRAHRAYNPGKLLMTHSTVCARARARVKRFSRARAARAAGARARPEDAYEGDRGGDRGGRAVRRRRVPQRRRHLALRRVQGRRRRAGPQDQGT